MRFGFGNIRTRSLVLRRPEEIRQIGVSRHFRSHPLFWTPICSRDTLRGRVYIGDTDREGYQGGANLTFYGDFGCYRLLPNLSQQEYARDDSRLRIVPGR